MAFGFAPFIIVVSNLHFFVTLGCRPLATSFAPLLLARLSLGC